MSPVDRIRLVQLILGVEPDGISGPKTEAAWRTITRPAPPETAATRGLASSFADPADIRAFRRCKATGKSDQECFKVGDNGIGCWGDDTTAAEPMCALPPDDMEARWGSIAAARHARVIVTANRRTIECKLADRMPWKKNIKNGAIIDLNPAACRALGLTPPILTAATWEWAEKEQIGTKTPLPKRAKAVSDFT